MQQQYFYDLADHATRALTGGEVFTAFLSGEASDFCRLNGAKVRQAGHVRQAQLALRLIDGQRNAEANLGLSGAAEEDRRRLLHTLATLRAQVAQLPDDPHLMINTEIASSERRTVSELPDAREAVATLTRKAHGLDMVGIYAAGTIYRAFANSLGQRNWYETHSFNADWSLYLRADKAVKSGYAGRAWNDDELSRKLEDGKAQLAVLGKEPRQVGPGRYRVYLAPQALAEVTDMLHWGGFSLKSHRTKQTPLLKMVEANTRLHDAVTMVENTEDGIAPDFNASGFTKPRRVTLIDKGQYRDCLVSARSAKEYGVATNGASEGEAPQSLEIAAGALPTTGVAAELGEGIYVNNLWYLNFSDRSSCRVTGMTRFASFWVEGGKIVRPLSVMRFDESVLRMLGDKLVGLTAERDMILSASTYGQRATQSVHLPGALVDDFSFTL